MGALRQRKHAQRQLLRSVTNGPRVVPSQTAEATRSVVQAAFSDTGPQSSASFVSVRSHRLAGAVGINHPAQVSELAAQLHHRR